MEAAFLAASITVWLLTCLNYALLEIGTAQQQSILKTSDLNNCLNIHLEKCLSKGAKDVKKVNIPEYRTERVFSTWNCF
jgi:hypothetical protein